MNAQELARQINVPTNQISRLLSMSGSAIIRDEAYVALLKSVDKDLLESTLGEARAAYEAGLPEFSERLAQRYKLESAPMSAYTLGNWVVGALQFPEYLDTILEMHHDISTEVFVNSLPDLLEMVARVPKGSDEWQRALCILSLPLMRG